MVSCFAIDCCVFSFCENGSRVSGNVFTELFFNSYPKSSAFSVCLFFAITFNWISLGIASQSPIQLCFVHMILLELLCDIQSHVQDTLLTPSVVFGSERCERLIATTHHHIHLPRTAHTIGAKMGCPHRKISFISIISSFLLLYPYAVASGGRPLNVLHSLAA